MNEPAQPSDDAEQPALGPSLDGSEDPEIAALLDFEPVPRAYKQKGAWTPELQRLFIARLAVTGSVNKACDQLGKDPGGARRLYKAKGGESFRAAAEAAEALWERRNPSSPEAFTGQIPGPGRRKQRAAERSEPMPAQVLNEYGDYEDEVSIRRRAEEARDSIAMKLVRARRLYLREISGSAGKRAAFEILTELPVDWDKAAALEPQPFEPWLRTNQRQPDMILTAESGWMHGLVPYGPDKVSELRRAIDEHRAEEGLEPIDWDADDAVPSEERAKKETAE
jgi:hypothetical protein